MPSVIAMEAVRTPDCRVASRDDFFVSATSRQTQGPHRCSRNDSRSCAKDSKVASEATGKQMFSWTGDGNHFSAVLVIIGIILT
jgi:hypothetical protein